jgi:hypothetical protein
MTHPFLFARIGAGGDDFKSIVTLSRREVKEFDKNS